MTLSGCAAQVAPWQQLVARNTTITGTVGSADCANHGKVTYRFKANGREFTNSSYGVDRPCAEIKQGDAITVYYDPTSPSVNTPMSPPKALCFYQAQAMTPFWIVGFIAVVIGLQLARKRWRNG